MNNKSRYWIYILECSNGGYYTGYTNDIKKRYLSHINGTAGAKYTRTYKPVRIAQLWKLQGTRGEAMKVEAFIKKNSRKYKIDLMKNPGKLKKAVFEKLGLNLKILKNDPLKYTKSIILSIK